MNKAMLSVTAIGLAGMLLVSFAATGKPPQTDSHATQGRGKAESCGGHQEPPSHARGGPNRKTTDAKASNCRGGKGQVSDADESPSEEEGEMKTNSGFVTALLLSLAASSASASEAHLAIGGCHTTSPRPGVPAVTIEEGYFFCGTILGQPVCSPEIVVDGIPPQPETDEYCSQLSSSGSGSLVVKEKTDCPPNQTGVVVERTGASTFAFSFKKNGVSLLPPIEVNNPPSTLIVADFCFRTPPG